MIMYKEEQFHKECFVCHNCSNLLECGLFKVHEDRRFCYPCFALLFSPRCTKCKEPIKEEEGGAMHDGLPYHKQCLLCAECGSDLADIRFFHFEGSLLSLNTLACLFHRLKNTLTAFR